MTAAAWYETWVGDAVTGLAFVGLIVAVVNFLWPFPGRRR